MHSIKKISKKYTAIGFLLAGFIMGATALSALANWQSSPAGTPPGNCDNSVYEGCNPPVTTSANSQIKVGNLTVNSLGTAGLTFKPAGVTPQQGQVLMTNATNASGEVSWGSISGSIPTIVTSLGADSVPNGMYQYAANIPTGANYVLIDVSANTFITDSDIRHTDLSAYVDLTNRKTTGIVSAGNNGTSVNWSGQSLTGSASLYQYSTPTVGWPTVPNGKATIGLYPTQIIVNMAGRGAATFKFY